MARMPQVVLAALVLLFAATSSAQPAPVDPRLESCKSLRSALKHKDVRVERVPGFGGRKETFFHVARKGGRYIASIRLIGDRGSPCTVFPISRAKKRIWGRFWPGVPDKSKVFVLTREDPGMSSSDYLLVLRSKGGKLLFATHPEHCNFGVTLKVLKLFDGLDTLQVTCQSFVGSSDYDSYLSLWHVFDNKPHRIFTAYLGTAFGDAGGDDDTAKDESKVCDWGPAGWIRVKKRGGTPMLRVAAVTKDPGVGDGDVWGTVANVSFDPKQKKFVYASKRRKTKLARKTYCYPRE